MNTYAKIAAPKFEDDYVCRPNWPANDYRKVSSGDYCNYNYWQRAPWMSDCQFFRPVDADGYMRVHRDELRENDGTEIYHHGNKKWISVYNYGLQYKTKWEGHEHFRRFIPEAERILTTSKESEVINMQDNTPVLTSPETKPLKDGEEAEAKYYCEVCDKVVSAFHTNPLGEEDGSHANFMKPIEPKEPTITLTEAQLHLLMADYLLYNQTHGDMNNREWLTNYRKENKL